MKRQKPFIIVLCILLLGLLGWWHWHSGIIQPMILPKAQSPAVKQTPTLNPTPAVNQPTQAQQSTSAQYIPSTMPAVPMNVFGAMSPDDQAEVNTVQKGLDQQNLQAINLYGKVVDQNGQPVPGVSVRGGVQLNVNFVSDRSVVHETETDGQGKFSFTNLNGLRIGIMLEKQGYEYNPKVNFDWNKNYKPDPSNPVVYTIYKLQGAEPITHAKVHDYIPCDGTEIHYDLQIGKKASAGTGLIVKFTRNPVQIPRGKPFEWTLVMTVPDSGGLIEIHDPYPYEAPSNGYQQTIAITTGPNPSQYVDSASKSYYYKSSDGKYGRITITLQADFQPPPTLFNVDSYLNPSGSRNLEWDETKQVKP